MSDVDGVSGSLPTVATSEPPTLWPLPFPFYANYASSSGNLQFGWKASGFEIAHNSLVRSRVLHQSPLTKEGWSDSWRVMVSQYPQLAAAVSARVEQGEGNQEVRARLQALRLELEDLGQLARLDGCVLLGGYGFDNTFVAGARCSLVFTNECLWVTTAGSPTPRIRSSYSEARSLDFSGPGRVRKGGGFIGGGFGLTGAAEGMIVASVLNALTTKTSIHTMVRWEAQSLEAFFFTSEATPGDLRIKLSAVVGRVSAAKDSAVGWSGGPDILSELERLGSLRQQGIIDDDEFAELKRQIISRG